MFLLLLFLSHLSAVTGSDGCKETLRKFSVVKKRHTRELNMDGCLSDRDTDHRPRASCVGQGLAAVPDGIDPGTQVILLSQNQFLSLSWTSYSNFSDLHELNLNQNLIRTTDQSGPVLSNLKVLRLSNNKLSDLGPAAFSSAPALMEIYLDGNALCALDEATFSDLPILEIINLSRNKLHDLPPRLLECVSSSTLKTFDVEDNQIQHLPDGFFASKPDLPYVYLSQNPWVCSCLVGYLQSYLEDQGHNVYKHTGPTTIESDPENVVCAAPVLLEGRAIVDLTTDDYCSGDVDLLSVPIYHRGDFEPQYTKIYGTPSSTQPIRALLPMTSRSVDKTTAIPTTTELFEPSTAVPLNIQPTFLTTAMPTTTAAIPSTAQPTTSTTTKLTTTAAKQTTTMTALPSTIHPTTTTATNPTTMTTIKPTIPTTIGSSFWTRLQSRTIKNVWTFRTENRLSSASRATTPATSVPGVPVAPCTTPSPPVVPSRRYGRMGGSVPWCWWLFLSFLLLCILSVIFSSILILWLIITYLTLYRPIKQRVYGTNNVTLMAYQVTAGKEVMVNMVEEDRVPFLPPEMIRDIQPVFRSVLIVSKGTEEEEDGQRVERERNEDGRENPANDATTKIELVSATPLRREADVREGKEVFRKTLYRVISREEELEGWTEVEESRWGVAEGRSLKQDGGAERGKTRYSLILREERGGAAMEDRTAEAEWVVGEWEMGGGERGRSQEGWGSLIRRMEGWGLPDSTHFDTPEDVAETHV